MKNSLLLKIATGLCVVNVLLALWSSWTMSNARSRLAVAENAIREADSAITAVRSAVTTEAKSREAETGSLKTELKTVSQILDRLLKPPAEK